MKPYRITAVATALTSLTLLCGAGEPAPAKALPEVLGNLTCTLGEKVATETGADAQKILCVFGSLQAGAQETYEGTAYFAAGGRARDSEGALSWIVKGPSTLLKSAGRLEQTYTQGTSESGSGKDAPLIAKETSGLALHPRGLAEKETAAAQAASRAAVIDLKLRTTPA